MTEQTARLRERQAERCATRCSASSCYLPTCPWLPGEPFDLTGTGYRIRTEDERRG